MKAPTGSSLFTMRWMPALLGLTAILAFVFFVFDERSSTDLFRFVQRIEAGGNPFRAGDIKASASFFLIASLMIMVGTPRLIFFTLGGASFGFAQGLLWSIGACLTGSFLTFILARHLRRTSLIKRLSAHPLLSRMANAQPSTLTVALLRMLPISNLAVSSALALGKVRRRTFLLGSLLGYLPQGIIAVLVGDGLADNFLMNMINHGPTQTAIRAVVIGVLLLAFYFRASPRVHQWVQQHFLRTSRQTGDE